MICIQVDTLIDQLQARKDILMKHIDEQRELKVGFFTLPLISPFTETRTEISDTKMHDKVFSNHGPYSILL